MFFFTFLTFLKLCLTFFISMVMTVVVVVVVVAVCCCSLLFCIFCVFYFSALCMITLFKHRFVVLLYCTIDSSLFKEQ